MFWEDSLKGSTILKTKKTIYLFFYFRAKEEKIQNESYYARKSQNNEKNAF